MPKDRGGITQRLATWLNQNGISTNNTILVGVSGGNDSMVLAESLVRCGHPIEVGHVNYQLRGAESDGDAKHVRAWCASRKVVLHEHTERPDELGEGVQSEARRIRYRWFANIQAQIALKTKAPVYIALAHHADDQAETVLLHLLRSSNPLAPSSMKSMNQSRMPMETWRRSVSVDSIIYSVIFIPLIIKLKSHGLLHLISINHLNSVER